ncbi:Uncharacterized protein, contains caspase domain [Caballeronia arationis]|uniref:Uncharacterized protein, contains caspase domain n=1 Tax=Caballeronia arationis TaxID=1777142 RepID=A0A7Z7I8E2_9BURK|nr:caspase family protein [Caballeronia arationis]SOE81018.1 Uncharacterized protein, contains caspase domain [Caballeronia arationis]
MDSHRYALLVGSWEYQNAQLRKLASPVQDVRALEAVLADSRVGAFDRVDVLENRTAQEIRIALVKFFKERGHDDLLLLYFSGHGLKDELGHFYFAACDTDPNELLANGVAASLIHEVIQRCRSRKKVIFIDSCFGGAVVRGLVVKSGAQVTPDQLAGDATGLVIVTATDSMTYAFEGDKSLGEAQPSIFTKHLVNGLTTGEADLEHDGEVTVDELYAYIRHRVSQEMPGQMPKKWDFEAAGRIVVALNANASLIELPKEIQEKVDDWFPPTKVGAVDLLVSLGKKPHMKQAAIAALEKLVKDDSDLVKVAARSAISRLAAVPCASLPAGQQVKVEAAAATTAPASLPQVEVESSNAAPSTVDRHSEASAQCESKMEVAPAKDEDSSTTSLLQEIQMDAESPIPQNRLAALNRLTELKNDSKTNETVIQILSKLSQDNNRRVRACAADALSRLPHFQRPTTIPTARASEPTARNGNGQERRRFLQSRTRLVSIAVAITLTLTSIWFAAKYFTSGSSSEDQVQAMSPTGDNSPAPASASDGNTATRPHTAEDVYDKPAKSNAPATAPDGTPSRPHTAEDIYDKPANTN